MTLCVFVNPENSWIYSERCGRLAMTFFTALALAEALRRPFVGALPSQLSEAPQ